jgi:signal transduction histidine kinase
MSKKPPPTPTVTDPPTDLLEELMRPTALTTTGDATPEDVLALREAPVSREFLIYLNHELRSPLQVVVGFAELLAVAKLNEPEQTYALEVVTAARRLMRLADTLTANLPDDSSSHHHLRLLLPDDRR